MCSSWGSEGDHTLTPNGDRQCALDKAVVFFQAAVVRRNLVNKERLKEKYLRALWGNRVSKGTIVASSGKAWRCVLERVKG